MLPRISKVPLVARSQYCKIYRTQFSREFPTSGLSVILSFNIGLFVAFVLGLTASDMKLGSLDSAAFVVGFPILGCILQCMLLPLVYDSPVSLGLIQDYSCSQLYFQIQPYSVAGLYGRTFIHLSTRSPPSTFL